MFISKKAMFVECKQLYTVAEMKETEQLYKNDTYL